MRLKEIIGDFTTYEALNCDCEISGLAFDSRAVRSGYAFFCLDGKNTSGEKFVDDAIKRGARCVVSEKRLDGIEAANVVVGDCRAALSAFSAAFYNHPEKRLKIIGLVGTNGKTSTSRFIQSILERAGKHAAVIGTLGVSYGGENVGTDMTTPDPVELFAILDDVAKRGAEYAVMEVSAHAIFLRKVSAIHFAALVYTNCTEDHLDFFSSFEEYRETKRSIMNLKNADLVVVNADDPMGAELAAKGEAVSYAIDSPADVFCVNLSETARGTEFVINLFDSVYRISMPLLGKFNAYNALAAATVTFKLGLSGDEVADGLNTLKVVEGRMQRAARYRGGEVFVDYAHTPDGLEKSLLFLRKITRGNLVCLFGCGGNREKEKRPVMGRIAGDIADYVIITSDNPRYENPEKIIDEIETGVKESTFDYERITSREDAIKAGLGKLGRGDTLLIAGKGAENYQEIDGVKRPFSDVETVQRLATDG